MRILHKILCKIGWHHDIALTERVGWVIYSRGWKCKYCGSIDDNPQPLKRKPRHL